MTISKFDNFNFSLIDQSAKMTKKKPKFGALPKLNMPKKSHESSKPSPRPERSVVKCNEGPLPHSYYKGFSGLCQRVKSLKSLGDWSLKIFEDKIVLKKTVHPYVLPRLEIIMDDSLGFTVKVFGSYLPEDHPLYLDYRRTVRNITVSNLIRQLEGYRLCDGVSIMELNGKLYHHVIPLSHDTFGEEEEQQEVERRKKEHGNRLLMPNYHVEKSQKQIKCFFLVVIQH